MEQNYDAMLEEATKQEQEFDVEAWAEKKKTEREDVYGMLDQVTTEVSTSSETFQKYLDVQSHFSRYSVSNALLILAQMPQATRLKDFEGWKDNHVSIKKSQRGIRILEPGEEYKREDGSIGISYNVKKVFDISQTKAKRSPIAQIPEERSVLKALISRTLVSIQTVEQLDSPEMGAFFDVEKETVLVKKGMNGQDLFRAVAQELAHAELSMGMEQYSRNENTFRAYCVSYLLCKQYGIPTEGYQFTHLPKGYEGAEPQAVRTELSVIRDVADSISGRMARILNQERNEKSKETER